MRNPFSLDAFLYWVENYKDPTEFYDYYNIDECAIAQYMKFLGMDYRCSHRASTWPLELVACNTYNFDDNYKSFGQLAKDIRKAIAKRNREEYGNSSSN